MKATLTSQVTSKGQVTIPAKVRRELKIETGSQVRFTPWKDGAYFISPIEHDPLDTLRGFLKYSGPPVSFEDMDETIAKAALERQGL